MKKSFKTVQEALAKQREVLDKLANLDEIAQTRELNEEEKNTLAALQREHTSNQREIAFMNQQQAAATAAAREDVDKNQVLREHLIAVRNGKASREVTLLPVSDNAGGSITDSGAINLTIHELIPTLQEGLGLPPTLRIVTGVTGNDVWPVSVDDAKIKEMGENVRVGRQELHFDKITATARRLAMSIGISNNAIDDAAFDVLSFVQSKFTLALKDYLAQKLYSQGKWTGNAGPFSGLTPAGTIEIKSGVTYKEILKAVAQFTNKGFDDSQVCLVIDAITEAELKATKKDEDAGFIIENGLLAGYRYVVSHYINTTNSVADGELTTTPDRYLGIGYFQWMAVQQHGVNRFNVDSTSDEVAASNLVAMTLNTNFSFTDLSTKINKKGGTTTQAFALYKLTQPQA